MVDGVLSGPLAIVHQTYGNANYPIEFSQSVENYTLSFDGKMVGSSAAGNGFTFSFKHDDGTSTSIAISNSQSTWNHYVVKTYKPVTGLRLTYGSGSNVPYLKNIMLVEGLDEESYIQYETAYDIIARNDIIGLTDRVSEIEEHEFTENVIDSLQRISSKYVRYSDGQLTDTQTYFNVYTIKAPVGKIEAYLYGPDTGSAAIAFYSSETISTSGYISQSSVQMKTGWNKYTASVPSGCKIIAITCRDDPNGDDYRYVYIDNQSAATQAFNGLENVDIQVNENATIYRFLEKPLYDHLFVNRTGDNVIIPHESLYHVRLSKQLGFNVIEANIAKTSDDVYIVNHFNNGKFGEYFHHVDGETDISDISVSSVTWEWVVENVRYNSTIPKYRTRPCNLKEFLGECRQNNLVPFVQANTSELITEVNNIMGQGNYIAYTTPRSAAPNAVIYHYVSNLTTKEAILEYCQNIGKPFIYGLGNPNSFTDLELKELVETLHDNGFWIGTSYDDTKWSKLSYIGFDFNGNQYMANRLENGNLCNLETTFGFNEFEVTGGTESNGIVEFSADGQISPVVDNTTLSIGIIDLEIWFTGTITVQSHSLFGNVTVTSDGSVPYYLAAPIIQNNPKIVIVCSSGAVVKDITFKASKI